MTASETRSAPETRAALIDAACDLLREGGRAGLTLRRAAARAGVSHAAPAHHFGNLEGLLAACAARGFALFAEALEGAVAAAGPDPRARLVALVDGYLAFAAGHEGLFAVMFRKADFPAATDPEGAAAADRALAALRGACAPFADTPQVARAIELQVWSLAHGYAFLATAGQLDSGALGEGDPGFGADRGRAAIGALLHRIGKEKKGA